MLNFGKFVLIVLIWCFSSLSVISQTPLPSPPLVNNKVRDDLDIIERSRDLQRLEREYLRAKQEALIRSRNPRQKPLTKEERKELEKILEPDAEDLAAYKVFLKRSNTGIFRLFPDFNCDSKLVVRVDNECSGLVSYKWSYSFRQKDYGDEAFFDVRLKDEKFISDALLTQGVLTNLGDVALEQVTLSHEGIKFLSAFNPELQSPEAKKQSAELAKGLKQNGYYYSKNVEAKENTTYAMRVAAYRIEDKYYEQLLREDLTSESIKYVSLFADKRADIILAFRVVRKDSNRSLTIVWKLLENKKAPRLVFPKNEKLSDINVASR